MAKMTVRSTYALDPETVRKLEGISREWGVSKSEALRRAIGAASLKTRSAGREAAVGALEALQESLALTARSAGRKIREMREERRSIGRKLGS
jgi:hypothetical protein